MTSKKTQPSLGWIEWTFRKGHTTMVAIINFLERLAKQVRTQGLWTIRTTKNVHHQIGLNVRSHGWRKFLKVVFLIMMFFVGLFLICIWSPIRAIAK